MLNCSNIVVVRLEIPRICMMMSWIMSYENWTYDTFTIVRVRSFQELDCFYANEAEITDTLSTDEVPQIFVVIWNINE